MFLGTDTKPAPSQAGFYAISRQVSAKTLSMLLTLSANKVNLVRKVNAPRRYCDRWDNIHELVFIRRIKELAGPEGFANPLASSRSMALRILPFSL